MIVDRIVDIITLAIDIIIKFRFFFLFANDKRKRGKPQQIGMLMAFFSGYLFITLAFRRIFPIKISVGTLLLTMVMWWFFKQSFWRTLALSLICMMFTMVWELLYVTVIQLFFSLEALNNPWVGGTITVIGFMIELFLLEILGRFFSKKNTRFFNLRESLILFVIPFSELVLIVAVEETFGIITYAKESVIYAVSAFWLILMNLIFYYLLYCILQREDKVRRYQDFEQQMKKELQMYNTISENYNQQRKRTHEFRNHMLCIESLVNAKEYDSLEAYMKNLNHEQQQRVEHIDTEHVIVNAILNSKFQEMQKKEIMFVPVLSGLNHIPLDDKDIVIVLSNLLNNAIEACEHAEKRVIKLKFVREEDEIVLAVQNTCKEAPRKNGVGFQTTKADAENHGIGIENIVTTIERYDGEYNMEYKDGWFYFWCLLPCTRK